MRLLPAVAAAALTLLAGCSTIAHMNRAVDVVHEDSKAADAALATMRAGKPVVEDVLRVVENADYLPPAPIVLDDKQTMPSRCNITFAPASAVTILELGQIVTKICGVQVRVTSDALAATQFGAGSAATPTAAAPNAIAGIPLPAGVTLPGPTAPTLSQAPFTASPNLISIRYSGDLVGLLNAATARMGLSWRYADSVITIFYLDTRFYSLHHIPTMTSMKSTTTSGMSSASGVAGGGSSGSGGGGGGGSGGGSGGGVSGSATSSQSTSVELKTDAAADLQRTVESMLTPNVGRMAMSAGSVAVTDTPEVLDRIGAYVDHFNDFATKQVLLNIKVLTVTINDNDEFGINWNLIYQSLADQYGIGLVNNFGASDDAVTGSVNILQGSSRFSGSQLVVNALNEQGRVSVLTQPSETTLNLEPVSVQVGTQTGFLASSSTTLTADVGATSTLQPGSVTTGFNINVLPHILPDSRTVLLQLSLSQASLESIRRVESGNAAIEIPEVANRILSQKVRMRSGETLVLSGFEQTTNSTNATGTGHAFNWLFGGGAKAKKQRDVLVLLITPIVQQ